MIICITGTPGTGKTYFANKLSKALGYNYMDLNRFIRDKKLYDDYDRKAKTFDVDTDKLDKMLAYLMKPYRYNKNDKRQIQIYRKLNPLIGKHFDIKYLFNNLHSLENKENKASSIIIDSHLSHYLRNADFCFVITSDTKKIYLRLKKRGYGKTKIQENIDSEIFGICLEEAKALNHKIIIIQN